MAWALQVFSLRLRKTFSYRVDFWMSFLGGLLTTAGVSYLLWKSIYTLQGLDQVAGFSLSSMTFYYVLTPLNDRLIRGQQEEGISVEIYDGSLTRYLVYPISVFMYKYIERLADTTLALVQTFVVVGLFAWLQSRSGVHANDLHLTPISVIIGTLFAVVAGFVLFTFQFLIELTAFWAENVWSLLVMLRFATNMLGGAMLPLALYPESMQHLVSWTPFPYLISVPIQLTLGRMGPEVIPGALAILLAWEVILLLLLQTVWDRGSHQYSGVGM